MSMMIITTTTVNNHDQVSAMDKTLLMITVHDGDHLFLTWHTNKYECGATDNAGRGQSQ